MEEPARQDSRLLQFSGCSPSLSHQRHSKQRFSLEGWMALEGSWIAACDPGTSALEIFALEGFGYGSPKACWQGIILSRALCQCFWAPLHQKTRLPSIQPQSGVGRYVKQYSNIEAPNVYLFQRLSMSSWICWCFVSTLAHLNLLFRSTWGLWWGGVTTMIFHCSYDSYVTLNQVKV